MYPCSWGVYRTPVFVPVQLQLVGGHVSYGLGISSCAGEGTVDPLVQRGQLVEHPVHNLLSDGKEPNVIVGVTRASLAMLRLKQEKQTDIMSAR